MLEQRVACRRWPEGTLTGGLGEGLRIADARHLRPRRRIQALRLYKRGRATRLGLGKRRLSQRRAALRPTIVTNPMLGALPFAKPTVIHGRLRAARRPCQRLACIHPYRLQSLALRACSRPRLPRAVPKHREKRHGSGLCAEGYVTDSATRRLTLPDCRRSLRAPGLGRRGLDAEMLKAAVRACAHLGCRRVVMSISPSPEKEPNAEASNFECRSKRTSARLLRKTIPLRFS